MACTTATTNSFDVLVFKSFKVILNAPNLKKKQIRVSSHSIRCTTDW